MNNQQTAYNFAATFETMLEHIDQLEAERPPASFLQTLEKYLELTDQEQSAVYKSLETILCTKICSYIISTSKKHIEHPKKI
jgi:hypothetical protein